MFASTKKPSASTNKRKNIPPLSKVVSNDSRIKYLHLKRNKFWHIAEEMRRLYASKSPDDVLTNDFNTAYVKMHHIPPLSAFRIKEKATYSYYPNSMHGWKENKGPRDPNSKVQLVTEEDFKKIHRCLHPVELISVSEAGQFRFNFTIEEKKGMPMYEMYNHSDTTDDEEEDEDQSDSTDDQGKKKMKYSYTPHRIVAPPEYPFLYYRLKKTNVVGTVIK